MALSLISVNIERDKHLDLVLPFLVERGADVVCIQEIYERTVPSFEATLGARAIFAPMDKHPTDPPESGAEHVGVAIFTPLDIEDSEVAYYAGSFEGARTAAVNKKALNRPVVFARVRSGGETFRVGSIHFTWSPDGSVSDEQRSDLGALFSILERQGDFALAGDFNAPRGGEIFSALAMRYTDNIPKYFTTSIDGALHRAGPLPYMVDGLFTTAAYRAAQTELLSGVSDHCAIVAKIEIAS